MEKCSICLQLHENLIEIITQTDNEQNENHLQQLQRIAPEIEWLRNYKICKICRYHLEEIGKFRKLCIKLDLERTQIYMKLQQQQQQHIEQKDNNTEEEEEDNNNDDDKLLPENLVEIVNKDENNTNTKQKTKYHCSCQICGIEMPTARHIRKHCLKEHNLERKSVRPFLCTLCNKRFFESSALKIHKLYHARENTVICPICGKGFITYTGLLVHKRTHLNQRDYKCDQCTKSFKTSANIYTHKLVVHTDPKLWKYCCYICNKRFPLKVKHDIHLRRHVGDKRFPCPVCGMLFVCNDDMRKHLPRHTNV